MVIEFDIDNDKAVSKTLTKLPKKSIFGVSNVERTLEGTDEIRDKRVRPSIVDDPERHNPSGTFLRSFSRENAKVFAKDGFMGMISEKTLFTVGEKGKKEFVKVKKKSNDFDFMQGLKF